jgi:hypothetical protein
MSDGQIRKPDKDFTKEVDKRLPEAEELAKVLSQLSIARMRVDCIADQCSSSYREAYCTRKANETGTLESFSGLIHC